MSNKPLLVLPPRYTEDSIALVGAANRAGWDVDVGRLADGRWAVIEANSAWGAGLYGCDPAKVLPVVRRGCVKVATATVEDRVWIIERAE